MNELGSSYHPASGLHNKTYILFSFFFRTYILDACVCAHMHARVYVHSVEKALEIFPALTHTGEETETQKVSNTCF